MRLIDADELIGNITKAADEVLDIYDNIEIIDNMPTIDAVPVIRCKNCKFIQEHKHYGDLGESAYTCDLKGGRYVYPDGYCDEGIRSTKKEVEEDSDGHWVEWFNYKNYHYIKCSACNKVFHVSESGFIGNYCPNCGKKMVTDYLIDRQKSIDAERKENDG